MNAAPLHGVKVVDFTELLPGPFLTQSLVELGADVVKVERPPHGDNARRMAPGLFRVVNRGKRSIHADLKDPADHAMVLELVKEADVLVEAYRPGVMRRLSLDYAVLRALNPGLIYVSLTGYGQQGARALRPGHDLNYQAASGALSLSGPADGRPEHVFGLPVADLCGSIYGLAALTAALFQRGRTGVGQYLDVAITECLTHWLNPRLGSFYDHGLLELSAQRRDVLDKPAYGVFRTADGRDITVCALENHFWQRLTEVLDLAPFDVPRYLDYEARAGASAQIRELLARRIAAWSADELERALLAADIPALIVASPREVAHDPAFEQRGLLAASPDGPLVRFPIRLDGMPDSLATQGGA